MRACGPVIRPVRNRRPCVHKSSPIATLRRQYKMNFKLRQLEIKYVLYRIVIPAILYVVLVEFVPEITVSISTSNVRIFRVAYIISVQWAYFILFFYWSFYFFKQYNVIKLRTNRMCQDLFKEIHYLYNFNEYLFKDV